MLTAVAIIPALLQLIMAAETAKAMGLALRLVYKMHLNKCIDAAGKEGSEWSSEVFASMFTTERGVAEGSWAFGTTRPTHD